VNQGLVHEYGVNRSRIARSKSCSQFSATGGERSDDSPRVSINSTVDANTDDFAEVIKRSLELRAPRFDRCVVASPRDPFRVNISKVECTGVANHRMTAIAWIASPTTSGSSASTMR